MQRENIARLIRGKSSENDVFAFIDDRSLHQVRFFANLSPVNYSSADSEDEYQERSCIISIRDHERQYCT